MPESQSSHAKRGVQTPEIEPPKDAFDAQIDHSRPDHVNVTIIREGDAETLYLLSVPFRLTVADMKEVINSECYNLVPVEAQEIRRCQEEKWPLPDFEVLNLMEGDMLMLKTTATEETIDKLRLKAAKANKGKCIIM